MGFFSSIKDGLSNINQSISKSFGKAAYENKLIEIEINGQKVKFLRDDVDR